MSILISYEVMATCKFCKDYALHMRCHRRKWNAKTKLTKRNKNMKV